MSRNEFSKPTKREALKRARGHCEATGEWYGLKPGQRCNAPLSFGVEFDHVILDAISKDASLANCAAVCTRCHLYKTRTHDTPLAAKTKRQQDKHLGVKKASSFPSRKGAWGRGAPRVRDVNADIRANSGDMGREPIAIETVKETAFAHQSSALPSKFPEEQSHLSAHSARHFGEN